MNENLLIEFINIYNETHEQLCYDMYIEGKQKGLSNENLLTKMLKEKNEILLSLIKQPCDHKKLIMLLKRYTEENEESDLKKMCKKLGVSIATPPITEPLAEWVFNYNYMLAYPMLGDFEKDDTLLRKDPEMILSFVYINLRLHFKENSSAYSFQQQNIDLMYGDFFEKPSVFTKWGLLPVDKNRILCAFDEPVRVYDKVFNKTIFIHMNRSLALVIDQLMNENYINVLSVRANDKRIYDGENHHSDICEAVEKGLIFSLNIGSLPSVTKLYSDDCFDNTLWILKDSYNLTFEELCEDFHTDGDTIVTQMIHLEYNDRCITHLDHEYIFYSIEEYENRIKDTCSNGQTKSKGKAKKRIKTFKIDKSAIPLNYQCKMYRITNNLQEEITVPFIYFVLNAFFEHKDLLAEYFSKCL